ncbi:hypothetical protein VW23_024230 [Devosia insulae DS-56]|uniref:N-acetyltransferase domain-containing protein n=1 Tax=Devosia insulae DS-56 TaxID=1116389 RepID=A0A1E5XME1_9HYPH|nr:GNAT family N-acetyltransferase [Devosia insulae]OEO29767.1 hypothetical protein VW23_024230 [Devosia insulae DS-56]
MEIALKLDPDKADVDAVLEPLRAYNREHMGGRTPLRQTVALHLKSPDGQIVGGLTGTVALDWLAIDLLHVDAAFRGQDHGTALMRQAEAYARERGLAGIWLDTFDFQARGFYEKLGYTVFGTIEGQPVGSRRYFLNKRLDGVSS